MQGRGVPYVLVGISTSISFPVEWLTASGSSSFRITSLTVVPKILDHGRRLLHPLTRALFLGRVGMGGEMLV